jgi:anaerobic selenocysteine-containing dehydrogenase
MLNRRQLLNGGIAAGVALAAGAAGAGSARAFSVQPMPPDVAAAYALGCGSAVGAEHATLIQQAEATLKSEIASGLKLADAQEIVVCPICGCKMVVSAATPGF